MSRKSQRHACSLNRLHRTSGGWKPFPALEHAEAKALLHTDLDRVLTAFREADVRCLMEWDYYAKLTKSDPAYVRKVRQAAQSHGIPQRLVEE